MIKAEFINSMIKDKKVRQLYYSRGFYHLVLNEGWYYFYKGELLSKFLFIFTRMKDVEEVVKNSVFIKEGKDRYEKLCNQIEDCKSKINSCKKDIALLNGKIAEKEEVIVSSSILLSELLEDLKKFS